ncbi:MAG: hypothetical protein JO262_20395 [Solirubrobacterales bacterium]|nr:hypothetical protein [Solirubrobacterales bacterium]MBV9944497.1 hypothetical protein [Solirubrobacterales bacterium]
MTELHASRTLVKSPPELWAECSDAASLARHLDRFGEIRITRLDPESAVAWEGEHARGTVRIEPAGWGTKVILTATAVPRPVDQPPAAEMAVQDQVAGDGTLDEPVAADCGEHRAGATRVEPGPGQQPAAILAPVQEPPAADEPVTPSVSAASPPRRRRFARLLAFLRGPAHEAEVLPMSPAQPEPVAVAPPEPELIEPLPEPKAVEPLPESEAVEPLPEPEAVEPAPEPEAVDPAPAPERPLAAAPPDPEAALAAALDSLGQAHHRPYSRA